MTSLARCYVQDGVLGAPFARAEHLGDLSPRCPKDIDLLRSARDIRSPRRTETKDCQWRKSCRRASTLSQWFPRNRLPEFLLAGRDPEEGSG